MRYINCPHCAQVIEPETYDFEPETEREYDCPHCDKSFKCTMCVDYWFEVATDKEEPNEIGRETR